MDNGTISDFRLVSEREVGGLNLFGGEGKLVLLSPVFDTMTIRVTESR